MKNGYQLLSALLRASEKSANIARTCRQNDDLFKMLIQEKSEEEKNPRFFQDFKTLADVLIQETIRHDIGLEFPELAEMVQGEENNTFSNTEGETIVVKVCSNCEDTSTLLAKVMGGNNAAAELLAIEVHRNIDLSDLPTVLDTSVNFEVDTSDLGLWVDPIDSTADYINGVETVDDKTGLHLSGLRCVTILIGAYSKSTGLPVLGIVNQPFYHLKGSEWTGMCYWGYVQDKVGKCSISTSNLSNKTIVLSRAEDANLKSKLADAGFNLMEVTGAGYKILSVATGYAAAYILSKASTYRWDVCAPHALLHSLGGGVLEYRKFLESPNSDDLNVKYLTTVSSFSNSNGLIAYRDPSILDTFKTVLCE